MFENNDDDILQQILRHYKFAFSYWVLWNVIYHIEMC